jgi:hypothetical protein
MSDLVHRLSTGRHPVEVSLRPERTTKALKECIDRGFVHIKFVNTRGGTELGMPVDRALSDFSGVDTEYANGQVKLVGTLNLDFVKVRCVANIDVPALAGEGHLEVLPDDDSAERH